MRLLTLAGVLLALATSTQIEAADTKEGLEKLKALDRSYQEYQTSDEPRPKGLTAFSLAVKGDTREILKRIEGDVPEAYHRSAGFSYVKSAASDAQQKEIRKEITDGLSALLNRRVTVDDKSAWRVLVAYTDYGSRLVSIGGGPYRPQGNYQVNIFVLNTKSSVLVNYQTVSLNASSTDDLLKLLIRNTADSVSKTLDLPEPRNEIPPKKQ